MLARVCWTGYHFCQPRASGQYFSIEETEMAKSYNVAVVGATGAVGQTTLKILEQRNFPVASLKLYASARSAGKQVQWKGQTYTLEQVGPNSFDGIDVALFSAGTEQSRE